MEPSRHTVRSFDEELTHLSNLIIEMGGHAESQLARAISAFTSRDGALAAEVVADDSRVDHYEEEIDSAAIRVLALRQPMAHDLRQVVTALKISNILERIADYASNVAKRSIALSQLPPVRPAHGIPHMGRLAQQMIKDVLDAYVRGDAEKALWVWQHDVEIDAIYESLFRELLTHMMEDRRTITACTHLLFIAKNIERIGDHATNVAELVVYQVRGERITASRPKTDRTSFAVVPAPEAVPPRGHEAPDPDR
ncbi:MAG: phosphate signaling complex protein PhoU [Alphaproteobacteria bacterium]|nr:phosphate signaling complex protein PhoU [Alphaproteobacteria bacterium]